MQSSLPSTPLLCTYNTDHFYIGIVSNRSSRNDTRSYWTIIEIPELYLRVIMHVRAQKEIAQEHSDTVQRSHQTSVGVWAAQQVYIPQQRITADLGPSFWRSFGQARGVRQEQRNFQRCSHVEVFNYAKPGVVIDARPRSHICNFSTMQRGASWPSNLNLRFARYHLRVRSSEDLSEYTIAESSPIWWRWTTVVSIRCNTWFISLSLNVYYFLPHKPILPRVQDSIINDTFEAGCFVFYIRLILTRNQ